MLIATQLRKPAIFPRFVYQGGKPGLGDQGRNQDVHVKYNSHRRLARLLRSPLGTHLLKRIIYDSLHLAGVQPGIARLDVPNCALKHPPPNSVFDELGKCAFPVSLLSQECPQRRIRLFGNLDVPPDRLFVRLDSHLLVSLFR